MTSADQLIRALDIAFRIDAITAGLRDAVRQEVVEGRLAPGVPSFARRLQLTEEAVRALLTLAQDAGEVATVLVPGEDRILAALRAIDPEAHGTTGTPRFDGRAEGDSTPTLPPVLPASESAEASLGGKRLGRYVLLALLGQGGMGTVYRAWDPSLARVLALKVLRGEPDAVLRERFLREGRAIARLRHPGIVAVHDVGEQDGRPYLAMDLLTGDGLREGLSRTSAAGLKGAVGLLHGVAEAVGYAHAQGIVHRDLKPENILLDASRRPVVTDFGLAKDVRETMNSQTTLTQEGAVLGTPAYMSPEQAAGEGAVGPRGDVFSLGVMLYEVLTGRRPFDGDRAIAVMAKVMEANPIPPSQAASGVPRDLETVCLKAIERDPLRRYADARALAADLSRWLGGEPVEARPVSWHRRIVRMARRHRTATLVAVAALAIAVTGLSVWLGGRARVRADVTAGIMRVREAAYMARQARRVDNRERMHALALEAERRVTDVIALDPRAGEAWLERGRIRALVGRLEEARPDLDRAVELLPDDPSTRAERGRLLATLYRRATLKARPSSILDPSAAPKEESLHAAGSVLSGLRDGAQADLSAVLASGTAGIEPVLARAYLLYVQGNWGGASTAAEEALRMDLSEEAYWILGVARLGQERYPEALVALDMAVLVGKGFGDAWLARAEVGMWLAEGHRHQTIEEALGSRGQLSQVIDDATRAEALGVEPALARILTAQALWMWGETERKARVAGAEERFARGIELLEGSYRFDDPPLLYLRGALWDGLAGALLNAGKDNREAAGKSVSLIEEILKRDPGYSRAWTRLGHSCFDLIAAMNRWGGDTEPVLRRAVEAYDRALAADPSDKWSREYRAVCRFDLARIEWERGPGARKGFEQALADFDALAREYPDEVHYQREACELYVALADRLEGRDVSARLGRAEEALRPSVTRVVPDELVLTLHGTSLVCLGAIQEPAAASAAQRHEDALAAFRKGLDLNPRFATAWLGVAIAEAGLVRACGEAGEGASAHRSRAFEALARMRALSGGEDRILGDAWLLEPLAETLLEGKAVAPAEALVGLAGMLARAGGHWSGAQVRERLHDLAFTALGLAKRDHSWDPGPSNEDPSFAPLRSDPRWAEIVEGK